MDSKKNLVPLIKTSTDPRNVMSRGKVTLFCNFTIGKPQPTKKDPQEVDLERKKASHIMHYLMERRQEQDY